MPTKIEVDCTTGEQVEIEMEGEELAAHEALVAVPDPDMRAPGQRVAELLDAAAPGLDAARTVEDVKEVVGGVFGGLRDIFGGGRAGS